MGRLKRCEIKHHGYFTEDECPICKIEAARFLHSVTDYLPISWVRDVLQSWERDSPDEVD